MLERLQKILARAGFASRRGAEQLMLEGRVSVNGEVACELGTKADLEHDEVRVDGVRVKPPKGPVYLVLNKPRGVVATRRDPEGRQTVMDLVPPVPGLFPVGRLDVTTEGLILLTNDGVFAERVSHPRYEVPRVYEAKVHGVPEEAALERLRRGVRVDDQQMVADRVRVLQGTGNAWIELTLHEGRHHEVRRMLEAVGHQVAKLRRVSIGPVTARGLDPGQFRPLSEEEIAGLMRGEGRREPEAPRRRRWPPRDRPRTDRPRTAGPRTDRPRTDRPRTAGPRTDRPRTGRGRSDRPASDRRRDRPGKGRAR